MQELLENSFYSQHLLVM